MPRFSSTSRSQHSIEEIPLCSTKTSMIYPDCLSDPFEALRLQATVILTTC
jgi:hypothetical protein